MYTTAVFYEKFVAAAIVEMLLTCFILKWLLACFLVLSGNSTGSVPRDAHKNASVLIARKLQPSIYDTHGANMYSSVVGPTLECVPFSSRVIYTCYDSQPASRLSERFVLYPSIAIVLSANIFYTTCKQGWVECDTRQ